MTGLDPEDSAPSPAGPEDTQSSDQSKGKLRQAWDSWTSRPENNAALLQFGIAMLQPRSPGQSGIGQAANAVGEAGQASERNVAAQEATKKQESDIAAKGTESAARTMTAQAYKDQVAQGGTKGANAGLQGTLRRQADFRKWLAKPEDNTTLTSDPVVGAISKQFPEVKNKADLLGNPAALAAARKLFMEQVADPADDEGDSGGGGTQPSPAPATAPVTSPAAPIRRYNSQGKGVEWNGKQWIPIN